jgi:hypothetical protein
MGLFMQAFLTLGTTLACCGFVVDLVRGVTR